MSEASTEIDLSENRPTPTNLITVDSMKSNRQISQDAILQTYQVLASILIDNPGLSTIETAKIMSKSPKWVATVRNSDTFQEYYKQRHNRTIDGIQKKTATMVELAMDRLIDRLDTIGDALTTDELNEIIDKGSKRLGFGVTAAPTVTINNGIVVDRGDLERARQKMQEKFGVTPDAPALAAPLIGQTSIGQSEQQRQVSPPISRSALDTARVEDTSRALAVDVEEVK